MAAVRFECRMLRSTCRTALGQTTDMHLRAYCYDTGEVYWELRRVLEAFYSGTNTKWETSRVEKGFRQHLANLCDGLGLDYGQEVLPSFRAAGHRDQASAANPLVRSEHSISTDALLAMLVMFATRKQQAEDKDQSSALLVAILSKLGPASLPHVDNFIKRAVRMRTASSCTDRADGSERCVCLCNLFGVCNSHEDTAVACKVGGLTGLQTFSFCGGAGVVSRVAHSIGSKHLIESCILHTLPSCNFVCGNVVLTCDLLSSVSHIRGMLRANHM
jgi:hypothetical protein